MACQTCQNPSLFRVCASCLSQEEKDRQKKQSIRPKRNWTIRQTDLDVATQAQVSTLDEALKSAKFWKEMACTYPKGRDGEMYNARAYAFLSRACELGQRIGIEFSEFEGSDQTVFLVAITRNRV